MIAPAPLIIGRHAITGKTIRIPYSSLSRHWWVPGRTGSGKSYFLYLLTTYLAKTGHAVLLLDGKGDLVEAVTDFCILSGYSDRLIVIDPLLDLVPGLNALEPLGGCADEVLAELVTEDIKLLFREQNEFQPWLEEFAPAALLALIKAGCTIVELQAFLSLSAPAFRHEIFKRHKTVLQRVMRKFYDIEKAGRVEYLARISSLNTRGSILDLNPRARAILGQTKTSFSWSEVRRRGGIVIVRAHPHQGISRRLRTLLATTTLTQLMVTARSTPPHERRDMFLVADEFQQFASESFAEWLTQMRSFRLWAILSHQEIGQLAEVPQLQKSVLAECTAKVIFGVSAEDSEPIIDEVFADYPALRGTQVKHKNVQTKFRPVESRRTVSSESWSESDTESEAFGESSAESDASSSTRSDGMSSSFSPFLLPGESGSFFSGSGASQAFGSSSAQSSLHGASHASSRGETQAEVPWYEFHEFREEAGRQYFSVEEIRMRLKKWLIAQGTRCAQLKIGSERAIPIKIAPVRLVQLSAAERERALKKILPRYARPIEVVLSEVDARVERFLENSPGESEPPKGISSPQDHLTPPPLKPLEGLPLEEQGKDFDG